MPTVDIHYSSGTDKIERLVTGLFNKNIPGSRGIEFKHVAYLAENKGMFTKMVAYLAKKMPSISPEELENWYANQARRISRLDRADTCIFIDNVPSNQKFIRDAKLNNATIIMIN